MNKFIGSGRLTKDPEVRYTQTGKCVCQFTLAMTDGYGDNAKSTFLPVVVWEKMAEACGNNLIKGQAVLVEGRIQVRAYEAQDGTKRYVTECVARNVEFGAKPRGAGNQQGATQPPPVAYADGQYVPDDEIPF